MITKEDFKKYAKECEDVVFKARGYSSCFHCKKAILTQNECYTISRVYREVTIAVFFHDDCFIEIAGGAYLLDSDLASIILNENL